MSVLRVLSLIMRPFLGIHAVNVFVRDQDRSLRFYVDQLGFHVAFDARLQSGERWVAVAPPDGSAVLTLVSPAPDSKEYKLIGRATGIVLVTEDVIAQYEEWRKRGVQFGFTPRLRRVRTESQEEAPVWGGVFTRFKDLDGNSFSLVGFDFITREIEADRRNRTEKLEAERRAVQELEIAKQVQARLFPQMLPLVETLEYAGACIQARQVGGDYHDFLDLGRGRFGLVIGDISGKGIAAALLMANLQANLRSRFMVALEDPHQLLQSVNRLFVENTPEDSYATLFYADYDDANHCLRYANCGHNPPLLLRANGDIDRLGATATVLGLFTNWNCEVKKVSLGPGDMLVIYTDGVTEAPNQDGEEFGESRLLEIMRAHPRVEVKQTLSAILDGVQQFSGASQADDLTLVIARAQ